MRRIVMPSSTKALANGLLKGSSWACDQCTCDLAKSPGVLPKQAALSFKKNLQAKPQQNSRSDTIELIYFLVLPKLWLLFIFLCFHAQRSTLFYGGGFFRLSDSTYRTARSESNSACTSAAWHPMRLAAFIYARLSSTNDSVGATGHRNG